MDIPFNAAGVPAEQPAPEIPASPTVNEQGRGQIAAPASPQPNPQPNSLTSPAASGGNILPGPGSQPGNEQPAPQANQQANAQPNAQPNPQVNPQTGPQDNPQAGQPAPQEVSADDLPIRDFSKVDIAGEGIDANVLKSFGKTCEEIGLTPRQAKALAQWQMDLIAGAEADRRDAEGKKLMDMWGKDFQRNQSKVIALCSRLDRMPNLSAFTEQLTASGAANNATVVAGLLALADMLGENSMGTAQGAGGQRTETAYEGICEAFARARAGNRYGAPQ